MKHIIKIALLGSAFAFAACGSDGDTDTPPPPPPVDPTLRHEVWVANRGASSLSVIDVATGAVAQTIALGDEAEPMYVNQVGENRVAVGDRANDRVLLINAATRAVEAEVEVGEGVFHQWVSHDRNRLYVTNDVDKTTSVISLATNTVVATVAMPADLAKLGGKPHDVFPSSDGSAYFVSYLGFSGDNDYVVRFSASNNTETHRLAVGKDPHLVAHPDASVLYIPCQESDQVVIARQSDLVEQDVLSVPGAHGATISGDGDWFYTTNLPQGGEDAIYTVDVSSGTLASPSGVATPMTGAPHNLVIAEATSQLFVTHSGPQANSVTVFTLNDSTGVPSGATSITVGTNPFGLGAVSWPEP